MLNLRNLIALRTLANVRIHVARPSVHTSAFRLNEAEASPTNEELDTLRKENETLLKQNEDLQDKYRRALAETENVRRRGQKQVGDAKMFAVQSFCKDLLEVADILNLAVDSVDKSTTTSDVHLKNLYDGVVMTKDVLLKTFDRHGLSIVSPEGQRFDPNLHDAVFQISKEQAKHEPGNIEKVLKIGYSLHGRPIRAAQVGVVKL